MRPSWLFLGFLSLGPPLAVAQQAPVWPPPPEPPRIRFEGQLRSEADFGRKESFFGRMKRSLSGAPKPGMIRVLRPYDIYTMQGEQVFVTDGMTPGVLLFDGRAKAARLLGADVPGGIGRPLGLGGDGTGRVYVADPGTARIVVFTPAGAYARTFGGRGVLYNPVDIAVDSAAARYYVADSYLHQILVFDSAGTLIGRIGKQEAGRMGGSGPVRSAHERGGPRLDSTLAREHAGTGVRPTETKDVWENRGGRSGEFRYPSALAVGPDGTLFVVDQMNFRIQAFDRTGHFVRQIGRLGDVPGSFARPKGVAVDSEGHLYVADAAFNNLQVFEPDGTLLLSFGSLGHGEGQHWMPLGLCIDRQDRIYVADRYNNRAAIYQYLPTAGNPVGPGVARSAAPPGTRPW